MKSEGKEKFRVVCSIIFNCVDKEDLLKKKRNSACDWNMIMTVNFMQQFINLSIYHNSFLVRMGPNSLRWDQGRWVLGKL